jgi:hypothetical protein
MAIYREVDPLGAGRVQLPITASGGPAAPPREWFEDPKLEAPTPLTITSDGRVYGHLAAWDSIHIGMPGEVRPPRSRSGYAYFNNKVAICADGSEVHVGNLTLTGGHAPLSASAQDAVKHYDDTNSAICDVRAGEDAHGIWLAGAVRASATDEQIRALRASAPSGDWRPINRSLELVAACQVNVPGFPIARARVASGEMLALVAAGALDMAQRRYRAADHDTIGRVAAMEAELAELRSQVEPLVASVTEANVEAKKAELRASVHAAE